MNHNRQMAVYTTTNRKARVYQAAPQGLQELFDRLKVSQPIPYTIEAYKALPKTQQDDLKDIGGYVLGELKNGRRKAGAVLSRSGAVLDADNLPAGSTDEFIRRVAALGLCCCVYSTAKHCPQAPRLRVVFPFSEDLPAEQYPPVARLLCQLIQQDMGWFDPTTAQAERMMYWAAHCQDVAPVWYEQDGQGLLDAAALLAQLPNWQDPRTWPAFPREQKLLDGALRKAQQQDPESKEGIVGAFCRVYNVPAAMARFLPGVYEETATEGRYTFTGGSTWGGAVVYDNGKFLYSNHATDPAGGKLVNAFDLVRLHRFGDLDDGAKEGAKGNRLPSYAAMCELAREDEAVAALMARERGASAVADFQGVVNEQNAVELGRLAGEPLSLEVVRVALKAIGTQVRRNLVTNKAEIIGMPAAYSQEDAVNNLPTVLWDLLRGVGVKGVSPAAVRACLGAIADENRYNPVLDMLHTTAWDGVSRFPVLLDILNIDSNSFYALLVRKWLIQCVALIHNTASHQESAEGVLVIQGPQGIGKTTLFRKLAVKSEWLSEGVTLDMKNKDDIIRATSVWITELGELDDTLKKEQASLKSFITQKVDKIRAPYAAELTDRPRRTSFGATVNRAQFLKDDTGDRRFFVIPVKEIKTAELLALQPDWVIQLWAEVYILWWREPWGFRLSKVEKEHLNTLNQQHREISSVEEEIRLALNWNLPPEQWGRFTAGDIKRQLFSSDFRAYKEHIGKALAKMAREDSRITYTTTHGVKRYWLPLKNMLVPNGG